MAFTVKKTIGQKRKERQGKIARTIAKPKTNDRYDKIIAEINKQLGGQGRVFRGSDYQKREYDRRTTGIPTLDYITNGGLPKGGLVEIGGCYSSGKAQPIDTPVLTPGGFAPIGTLCVGDAICGADGEIHSVLGVYPQGRKEVFRIVLTDGTSTECCEEHLWRVRTIFNDLRRNTYRILPLSAIMQKLTRTTPKNGAANLKYIIETCQPVTFAPKEALLLDPYLMGALLGDGGFTQGCVQFSKPEYDLKAMLEMRLPPEDTMVCITTIENGDWRIKRKQRNNEPSETVKALRAYGLDGLSSLDKYIPEPYLYASIADRKELLAGLLDTDGCNTNNATSDFCVSSKRLAEDTAKLARSLGAIVYLRPRQTYYSYKGEKRAGQPSYRLSIHMAEGLPCHTRKHHCAKKSKRIMRRCIALVEPVGEKPCVCIRVSAPDSLYLTTDFIPTHNTTMALHICAEEQKRQWIKEPDKRKGIGWVALEPFSKQYARECGFFIPYSDDECFDPATGEVGKLDSLERASSLELLRLEKMGVEDPYAELCPLVVVQEERGDVALDAALTMLRSNLFEIVVVDSLGVAKQTTWIEEKEVQDSADFSREPKMIGDYTTRALLALNARYDESNQIAKDGKFFNNTTLVHLNHVGMAIGTQSHTPWNAYRIKGGEGNKHNHHAIIFLWRSGAPLFIEKPGQPRYMYGQEMNAICIKSKIGPPWMQGSYDYYFQKHDRFLPGDINIAKDAVTLGLIAGLVQRAGSWFEYKGVRTQGREGLENALWKDTESVKELAQEAIKVLRR